MATHPPATTQPNRQTRASRKRDREDGGEDKTQPPHARETKRANTQQAQQAQQQSHAQVQKSPEYRIERPELAFVPLYQHQQVGAPYFDTHTHTHPRAECDHAVQAQPPPHQLSPTCHAALATFHDALPAHLDVDINSRLQNPAALQIDSRVRYGSASTPSVLQLAIAAVTEAIRDPGTGNVPFALVEGGRVETALREKGKREGREKEKRKDKGIGRVIGKGTRAVRGGLSMFLVFGVPCAREDGEEGEDQGEGRGDGEGQDEGETEGDNNTEKGLVDPELLALSEDIGARTQHQAVEKDASEGKGKGTQKGEAQHTILITARVGSLPGLPAIPVLFVWDSDESVLRSRPRGWRTLLSRIQLAVTNLEWDTYPLRGAGGYPPRTLFAPAVHQRAAQQTPPSPSSNSNEAGLGSWTAGVHVILNAWSGALNLEVDECFTGTAGFYRLAVRIANMAIRGTASLWLIEVFLVGFGYAVARGEGRMPPCELDEVGVGEKHGIRSLKELASYVGQVERVEDEILEGLEGVAYEL